MLIGSDRDSDTAPAKPMSKSPEQLLVRSIADEARGATFGFRWPIGLFRSYGFRYRARLVVGAIMGDGGYHALGFGVLSLSGPLERPRFCSFSRRLARYWRHISCRSKAHIAIHLFSQIFTLTEQDSGLDIDPKWDF